MFEVFNSLRRGLLRTSLLVLLAVLNLAVSYVPELIGWTGGPLPILAPLCMGAGLAFLGLAGADVALRILQPRVNAQEAAIEALTKGNIAAGLVYIGRAILMGVAMLLVATASRAQTPPAPALALLPVLKAEQLAHWPDMPMPSALGAQVEKETCITLKHRSCWNPRAELRTQREQGVGLGQITRAFRADGSTRFDSLAELRAAFPQQLGAFTWQNVYDSRLQLRAVVLKDLHTWRQVLGAATELDRLAMMFAAYNGGTGGLASDRRLCAASSGCDAGRWFGHVERHSLKAKTAVPGYGKSFFEINRAYVREVMIVRRARYLELDPVEPVNPVEPLPA